MSLRSVIVVFGVAALAAAPLRGQAPPAAGADPVPPPAPTRSAPQSWTNDTRALAVGDIVTIVVDEFTLAESNRDESAVRRRRRDVGAGVGMPGGGFGFDLGSRNDLSDRTWGEAARSDRFAAEISVRVVETAAGGLVRVEGIKKLQIDGHMQDVTVRGWLRSGDVRPGNLVESWRVADAEIIYGSNETLGDTGGGIWGKLFGWIIP